MADGFTLPPLPGTYVLLIRVEAPLTIYAGRLGEVRLAAGWYAYIGSAHGPGGLRARVARHRRVTKKQHWHIDSLVAVAPVAVVWAAVTPEPLECTWAAALAALPGAGLAVAGFGASDCGCGGHLIHLPDPQEIPLALTATTSAPILLY